MTVGEKIRHLRKQKGLSVDSMVTQLNISRSTLFRYENGEIGKIPMHILAEIAKILDSTPYALMDWQNDDPYTYISELDGISKPPRTKIIPLLGSIACGSPILAEDNIEGYTEIPYNIEADFVLRCKGDSMINARIYDGDIVYVKSQPYIENGQIGVVLIDDQATLKRVYKYENQVVLQPENPAYAPIIYTQKDFEQVRILGKVIAFISHIK